MKPRGGKKKTKNKKAKTCCVREDHLESQS